MPKENKGYQKRRRRQYIFIVGLCLMLSAAGIRIIVFKTFIHQTKSSFEKNTIFHGTTKYAKEQAILDGKYFLIDLNVPPHALAPSSSKSYHGVIGTFCPLDWNLHKQNPSKYPMFRVLVEESKQCHSHSINVDFRDIVQRSRAYDDEQARTQLQISGVAFHETRCGSTLVANLLAAMNSKQHRVYSESGPPIAALKACEDNGCSQEKHMALIHDVFYIMGRTNNNISRDERHVFYKFQSISVRYLHIFTKAFPNIPWIFVYRDSVEIIMSHFKQKLEHTRRAVCLRGMGGSRHPAITQVIQEQNDDDIANLSNAEYCAAHLASLCLLALQEYKRNPEKGLFVNYASLPEIMWETVVPNHFGLNVKRDEIENMKQVAGFYSKGHRSRFNEWKADSEAKQERASDAIKKAAKKYLIPYYTQLEEIRIKATK